MRALTIYCGLLLFCSLNIAFGQQYADNDAKKPVKVNYYQEINAINEKIKKDGSNTTLLNDRALLYMQIHEYEKSLEDIDKAIGIDPANPDLRYTKALILMQRERIDASLVIINEAIEISNKREDFYFFRARVYAMKEDYKNAIFDIDKILKLNPHCDYCYLQRAIWSRRLNMFYEEIRYYLYYLEISKDEKNKMLVEQRLKSIRKSDKYFNDLYKAVKKDIRKNGYPWKFKTWN